MRRILFFLLALMAFGTALPSASPAMAAHGDHRGRAMAAMTGHCHDEAPDGVHMCLGCAVEPAKAPAVLPSPAIVGLAPRAFIARLIESRAPGFEPPPPRLRG